MDAAWQPESGSMSRRKHRTPIASVCAQGPFPRVSGLPWLVAILLLVSLHRAIPTASAAEPDIDGQTLTSALFHSRPTEAVAITATLKVFPDKGPKRVIPLTYHVNLHDDGWDSIYETQPTDGTPAQSLFIVHREGLTSTYLLATKPPGQDHFDLPIVLANEDAQRPFADSDFLLSDLGYPKCDFFRWPHQEIVEKAIKRGQSCYKLESINPNPAEGAYARLVSWIDIDSGGPVEIHAYNRAGELFKTFKPEGVEKVNGDYKVKGLELRNRATDSRTVLEFHWE